MSTVYTQTEIIEAMQSWAQEMGQPPSCADWRHPSAYRPSQSQVIRRFGKWNHALEAAGFRPRPFGYPGHQRNFRP